MNISDTLYVTNRNDWRKWLTKNHTNKKEVWLIYYKKHAGKPRIPYGDAVEEALCFGWIDSIVRRIDEKKYARKFTPRKNDSKWSKSNKRRAIKMIKTGRMIEAGMAKIKEAKDRGKWLETAPVIKEIKLCPDLKKALMNNKKAWKNFNILAPSYKKLYVGWIASAKKEETRKRRLEEAIDLLEQNKKLGMK